MAKKSSNTTGRGRTKSSPKSTSKDLPISHGKSRTAKGGSLGLATRALADPLGKIALNP